MVYCCSVIVLLPGGQDASSPGPGQGPLWAELSELSHMGSKGNSGFQA